MSARRRMHAAGAAPDAAPIGAMTAELSGSSLFVVYWRKGRCRQLFAFRSQVRAASAARQSVRLPRRGARRPLHMFGVKLRAPGGGCALVRPVDRLTSAPVDARPPALRHRRHRGPWRKASAHGSASPAARPAYAARRGR